MPGNSLILTYCLKKPTTVADSPERIGENQLTFGDNYKIPKILQVVVLSMLNSGSTLIKRKVSPKTHLLVGCQQMLISFLLNTMKSGFSIRHLLTLKSANQG